MTRMEEALRTARHEAKWRVGSNFWDSEWIIKHVAFTVRDYFNSIAPSAEDGPDAYRDMGGDEAQRIARRLVREEWNDRLREQQSWPADEETSAERVQRVFEELEAEKGIITGMNFACCQRCGIAELSAEKSDPRQGYLFWHEQSTERMMTGDELTLHYGNFGKGPEKSLEVANAAVKKLREAGFEVEWNGSEKTAITVQNIVWRDRIEGDFFPETEDEE